MKIKDIDFPKRLLNALRDDKLVVFAGAGVSKDAPAYLPLFPELADMIAQETGEALQEGEPIDRFLGRLQNAGVNVHVRAEEALSCEDREATELHHNLLRIYSDAARIRIVTTNFDPLFEKAAGAVFDDKPEVFRAPALPLGRQFNGIVHVHGAVGRPNEMVLTDSDFGRAYLTEGWARRFLVELFRNFAVLFVGYSHDDTILSYLARALPVGEDGRRFALIGKSKNDTDRWRLLGIEPISYPQSSEDDHSILYKGVRGLAGLIQRSVLDWQREITEIAQKPPPFDEETADLIEDALENATRSRFFVEAASDPKWIDWLDKRGHLNTLFDDGTLSERDEILAWWLTNHFTYEHADKLFLLIGKHNMRLNPRFWERLGWKLGENEANSLDEKTLSRWVSLILSTIPVHMCPSEILLPIGTHCIERGMLDSLLQVFDAMAGNRLLLKQGFVWPDDNTDDADEPIDVELPLIGDLMDLHELWKKGLKPNIPQIAEPLFERAITHLEEQYLTQKAWHKASRKWERASYRRSAIEPHEQDSYPEPIDVVIDSARDCLEWLIQNQADVAAQRCIRLAASGVPLLRRLAVHGLSKRGDLTADDKIDWLLTHINLHDLRVHHEVFRAVRLTYPGTSPERREALIKAVWDFRWPNEEDPERERSTAYQYFNWFHWLHESDHSCVCTKQALDEVLSAYPDFKPSEHPDFTSWIGSIQNIGPQSPWTVEELLAKPAADWFDDLLSCQSTELNEFDLMGLKSNVVEAARRNFDWGLDLADAFTENGKWDVHFWSDLIRTWSEMELDEDMYRKVLYWIGKTELHPKYNREIASALYALVENGGTSYALNLLPQANKVAAALWRRLERNEPTTKKNDGLGIVIDHPAEILAEFWLQGLSLWRKEQDPYPTALSGEYNMALSDIVQDHHLPGRLGRTVLASQFEFILTVDEAWTRDNVLPLFDPDSDDFQAAWHGFLSGGNLNPTVADAMADLPLKAIERIDSDLSSQRYQFIKYYISMLAYFAEDPIDKWIPALFRYGSQEDKHCFVSEVGYRLRDMDEATQREWWRRWLKRYWENRLQNVPPTPLESGEIKHMLGWLPHLTGVFPEAVDLAIRMPKTSLQSSHFIYKLDKSNLWQRYPEDVAKLSIYLGKCDLPGHIGSSVRKLIDSILHLDISPELKQELKELKIQL